MPKIYYKSGYKYQLSEDYSIWTEITGLNIHKDFLSLDAAGLLTVHAGYCWDGPSGPAIDTRNFMRGSLVHDAGYQLMRECNLPIEYREYFDQLLREICLEDGMSRLRAWWVYKAVRWAAGPCADKSNVKPTLKAGQK